MIKGIFFLCTVSMRDRLFKLCVVDVIILTRVENIFV